MFKRKLRNLLCNLLFGSDYINIVKSYKKILDQHKQLTENVDKLIDSNKEVINLVYENCKITENILNTLIDIESMEHIDLTNITN